ncbi:hypothetical protein HZA41_02600 [Candidatus Peregrinibacteria bacterium]|nr:hypothetical protein [Candidatus Peregrinibacteria bacterium]
MFHLKFIIFTEIATLLILPATMFAQSAPNTFVENCDDTNGNGIICVELQEPLNLGTGEIKAIAGTSGVKFITNYIAAIYQWGAGMVGIVAVLNMVISGIQITTAADSERAASAKTRMLQSITAIAVLFLSGLILYTINPTFFTK